MPLVRFPGSRRRTYLSGYSGAGSRLYHVNPKYPDGDGHGGPPCTNCYIFAKLVEEECKKDYIGERMCNHHKQYFKDACGRDIIYPKYPDGDGHGGPPCSNCYIFAEIIEEETKKDYIGERECNHFKQYFKDACGRDISHFRKNWDKYCKSKDFKKGTGTDTMKMGN